MMRRNLVCCGEEDTSCVNTLLHLIGNEQDFKRFESNIIGLEHLGALLCSSWTSQDTSFSASSSPSSSEITDSFFKMMQSQVLSTFGEDRQISDAIDEFRGVIDWRSFITPDEYRVLAKKGNRVVLGVIRVSLETSLLCRKHVRVQEAWCEICLTGPFWAAQPPATQFLEQALRESQKLDKMDLCKFRANLRQRFEKEHESK
jgi:hypothetical protein